MGDNRDSKIVVAAKTLVAAAMLVIGFFTGAVVAPVAVEPQTPETTVATKLGVEARIVETTTVQYIDRPVPTVEYIERVKEIPVELRHFSDLEELKQWLQDKRNVATVRFQSPNATVDCDDYALELQHEALADGYIMSFEIIGDSEYNALFKTPLPPSQSLHAINLAIIGNDVYYIEPQTYEVVFVVHLD